MKYQKIKAILTSTVALLAGSAFFTAACAGQPQQNHVLSDYLQVLQEACVPVKQDVQAADVIMSVNSYYRGEYSVAMLLLFERADGKEFEGG